MSAITLALLSDFGDRLSPIVVKELRQGLRTRFFTTALILFHALIILLLGSVLLEAPVQMVNGIFWGAAGLMLLLVLPMRAFNELRGEATDGTLDMLTLTSISSARILNGKWVALFGQALLVAGSLLPYMVARYYFGGVEILREAVALLVLVLGSGIITAALLAFSSQPSVLLRLALAAGLGMGAAPLGFFTAFLVSAKEADMMLRTFFGLDAWQQWSIVAGALGLAVYLIWYFLAMGASRIASPSENHSTRKRVVVLSVHGVLTLIGLLLSVLSKDAEAGMWAFIPLFILTPLACMDVMTEEMPRFPMAVAGLAKRGRLGVLAGKLFHPGWAAGVFFSVILCGMTLSIIAAIALRKPSWGWENGPLLFIHCVFLAAFVPVVLRINRSNSFANWWVVQICMGALGILLSIFSGATGARDMASIGFLTPVTTLFAVEWVEYSSRKVVLAGGSMFSLLWLLAALIRARMMFPDYHALEKEALQDFTGPKPKPEEAA